MFLNMRVLLSLASATLPLGFTQETLRKVVRVSCSTAFPEIFKTKGRGVRIEVAFVTDDEIQKLNRTYRGKDKPTDVLSFGNFSSRDEVRQSKLATLDLGTLVLSLPFLNRSAQEDGVSWEREFVYVFSHGVLHLLGFDHEEEMFMIQDTVTDHFAPLHPTQKHV